MDINDLKEKSCNAFFIEHREELVPAIQSHLTDDSVLLLMGARDPSLDQFAQDIYLKM